MTKVHCLSSLARMRTAFRKKLHELGKGVTSSRLGQVSAEIAAGKEKYIFAVVRVVVNTDFLPGCAADEVDITDVLEKIESEKKALIWRKTNMEVKRGPPR